MKSLKEALIKKHATHIIRLPLEYENVLVPGNIITIQHGSEIYDCIVLTKDLSNFEDFPLYENKGILVRPSHSLCKCFYWTSIDGLFNSPKFPVSRDYSNLKITDIRGTLSDSELQSIKTLNDLKHIFNKYYLKYEKS